MSNRKKTHEKQDKIIEQLKKNQLALTEGIQDIMTLNQELPQITYEERKEFIANIENKFDEEDKKIIEYSGLDPPSALLQKNVDELQEYQKIVGKRINKTGHTIGCLKNRINNTAKKDLDEKTKEKN